MDPNFLPLRAFRWLGFRCECRGPYISLTSGSSRSNPVLDLGKPGIPAKMDSAEGQEPSLPKKEVPDRACFFLKEPTERKGHKFMLDPLRLFPLRSRN